jgi:hypothetical protein
VTVAKRNARSKLKGWGPSVTESDDTVKTKLVQVGRLELEHGVDTTSCDFKAGSANGIASLLVAETGLNELLAVLDEQLPNGLVTDRGNLDQLSETVANLSNWQCLEEREVKECVERSMVGAETVLELFVVDADLDTDASVDQADKSGGDTNEVARASVRSTGVTGNVGNEASTNNQGGLCADGTERVHGIDNLEHSLPSAASPNIKTHVHVLVELSALDDLPSDLDVVVVKVLLNLVLVDGVNDCCQQVFL